MTIVEFLEARLAEDEARAAQLEGLLHGNVYLNATTMRLVDGQTREAREVEAKRAIIALDSLEWGGDHDAGYGDCRDAALSALAAVYASHPDYDEAWGARRARL